MGEFNTKVVGELRLNAEILEKTASYISEIETKLSNSEAEVTKLTKEANQRTRDDEVAEPLSKLAGAGYTEEELQELGLMSKDVLEKLAHQAEQPASMGSSHGQALSAMDPLTKFLVS